MLKYEQRIKKISSCNRKCKQQRYKKYFKKNYINIATYFNHYQERYKMGPFSTAMSIQYGYVFFKYGYGYIFIQYGVFSPNTGAWEQQD